MNVEELGRRPATLSHAVVNTIIALLAALVSIASTVAHHYTVEVRPEVCPAVSTPATPVNTSPGGRPGTRR